ncbi:MAG: STAS/SEC14 domain-containing protein [Oxalobacteraceae bacterium]|nr:MAG: STAS/SEC14 domain-containing protein [Oxalobacteraceae bacterium]
MYRITIEKSMDLVEVKLGGMMSVDEVVAYINELRRQFVCHRLRSYRMVIDVTEMPIQSQDMIRVMSQHMAEMPKAYAIAVVTGKSLARMQIKRLFTQTYARITATVAEGRAWVLQGVEPTIS